MTDDNIYVDTVLNLKKRLGVSPTTNQSRYYHNIINQLKAAGINPYESIEKTAEAYQCINQKNLLLAMKHHVAIKQFWREPGKYE